MILFWLLTINILLEYMTRPEGNNLPRGYTYFFACFGISPFSLPLAPDYKISESCNLDYLTIFQTLFYCVQDEFDNIQCLLLGYSYLLIKLVGNIDFFHSIFLLVT